MHSGVSAAKTTKPLLKRTSALVANSYEFITLWFFPLGSKKSTTISFCGNTPVYIRMQLLTPNYFTGHVIYNFEVPFPTYTIFETHFERLLLFPLPTHSNFFLRSPTLTASVPTYSIAVVVHGVPFYGVCM